MRIRSCSNTINQFWAIPVKGPAAYEKVSPTQYFKNAKAPLLVLQGENEITSIPRKRPNRWSTF